MRSRAQGSLYSRLKRRAGALKAPPAQLLAIQGPSGAARMPPGVALLRLPGTCLATQQQQQLVRLLKWLGRRSMSCR